MQLAVHQEGEALAFAIGHAQICQAFLCFFSLSLLLSISFSSLCVLISLTMIVLWSSSVGIERW